MTMSRGQRPRVGFSFRHGGPPICPADRHATCSSRSGGEKVSRPFPGRVDLNSVASQTVRFVRHRTAVRCVGSTTSGVRRGWNLGATRNGHRKRSRVRVACGDAIRPRGVGTHSSHGHFGRSVVGPSFFASPVALRSDRRLEPRVRHLSRGSGLPAATLTPPRSVRFVRRPAPAGRTASATRRRSPVVNRAASLPAPTVGSSRGWRRRTPPDPRTRRRAV